MLTYSELVTIQSVMQERRSLVSRDALEIEAKGRGRVAMLLRKHVERIDSILEKLERMGIEELEREAGVYHEGH